MGKVGVAGLDLGWAANLSVIHQGSSPLAALALTKQFDGFGVLTKGPLFDAVRVIEQSQRQMLAGLVGPLSPFANISKVMTDALAPFNDKAKLMMNINHGPLADLAKMKFAIQNGPLAELAKMKFTIQNGPLAELAKMQLAIQNGPLAELGKMQRAMQIESSVLRETADAFRGHLWKGLEVTLGSAGWKDAITQATAPWKHLAGLAGLGSTIREDALGPLVALQWDLEAARFLADDPIEPEESDIPTGATSMTVEQAQRLLNDTVGAQLAPVLIELKSLVAGTRGVLSKGDRGKRLQLFLTLFSILCGFITIDSWYLARFGKQMTHDEVILSPEKTQQLRESMEFVIAFSDQFRGAQRICVREVGLRRTPKGTSILAAVKPGQIVRVLQERHEWIAVGFQAGDEWICGWVLKKYTQMTKGRTTTEEPVNSGPRVRSAQDS